jgi:hypothetical protein
MKVKIGIIIFTVLPLLAGVSETIACIGHLKQENWPPHAMFHMFMGLGGLLATYGLIIFLTWGPLKRGERWAWYAIGFAAATVHGGQLVSDVITDGGLRNQEAIVAGGSFLIGGIFVILISYGIGLSLTWSHTKQ